jgi:DNA-directed RNA polymerase specialized sigma24 family protein
MTPMGSMAEWREEAQALERFAIALTSEARLGRDSTATGFLLHSLVNRAILAAQSGDGPSNLSRRARLLALFIRLHRRHVRMQSIEDDGVDVILSREGSPIERLISAMPLEQREALLLVVLERLSHAEAAAVLEIPFAALIERLTRARAALSRSPSTSVTALATRRGGAPHLRLIK